MPVVGVEPTRYCYHEILSLARLPIPSHRQVLNRLKYNTIKTKIMQDIFSKKSKKSIIKQAFQNTISILKSLLTKEGQTAKGL